MGEMVSIVANKARRDEAKESRAEGSMTTGNGLATFTNEAFGTVRAVLIDGEPYFVGKDVADILGYGNTRDALSRHVDDEDKNSVVIHDGIPGNPNQVVINESGLYSLILGSKLPTAKAFKRWVTSEVLPSIRKNGAYMTPEKLVEVLSTPDGAQAFLTKMAELTLKNQALDHAGSRERGPPNQDVRVFVKSVLGMNRRHSSSLRSESAPQGWRRCVKTRGWT